jgi:ferredoxin-like protein FixX
MENNDYYTEMHDKLKAKNDNGKITVEMIGGLECGKCHY